MYFYTMIYRLMWVYLGLIEKIYAIIVAIYTNEYFRNYLDCGQWLHDFFLHIVGPLTWNPRFIPNYYTPRSFFFPLRCNLCLCFNLINSSYLLFFAFEFVCRILCQMKFTIKKQKNGHPTLVFVFVSLSCILLN